MSPGGHDHASPGGSFDVAKVIAEKVFGITAPVFQEYRFVGIQGLGSKMSGSKGNSISPAKLLEIYTPELLKWVYLRKFPEQTFELSFGAEIYKQYSEFDEMVKQLNEGTIDEIGKDALAFAGMESAPSKPFLPFRQAVGFGQIVQWDLAKLNDILMGMGLDYEAESITLRLSCAKNWIEAYNSNEAITLRETGNDMYAREMTEKQRHHITVLRDFLKKNEGMSISELEKIVYDIPKEAGVDRKDYSNAQRAFFKDVYNLLIGRDTGPRLSTFLWAIDRRRAVALLSI